MPNFLASLILVSLLFPSGFNFLTEKAIDYSYTEIVSRQKNTPIRLVNKSFGLATTAQSIVVVDDESETILYNKNPQAILPIASITKLITALVFLDSNPDWDKAVEINQTDYRNGGHVRLLDGEQVTVRDLFNLMLISSTNEAAFALARISGLENFVSAMNKKALDLGLADSYFVDPSGIEPENISSPSDLIKLANVAFSRTEITEALVKSDYQFEVVNTQRRGSVDNTNKLLTGFLNTRDYTIIGAKTGFLDEAGYCLLLQVRKNNGPSLTLVLLGSETTTDRWQEAKGLVDWIFRNYQWPELD